MSKLQHLQTAGSEHVCAPRPFQTKLAVYDVSQPVAIQIHCMVMATDIAAPVDGLLCVTRHEMHEVKA